MRTKIDVLQEGKIKRGTNGELFVLGEDNVSAIVTVLDSLQNILGVIGTVGIALDNASPGSLRGWWERLSRMVRFDWMVRPLGSSHKCIVGLERRRPCR